MIKGGDPPGLCRYVDVDRCNSLYTSCIPHRPNARGHSKLGPRAAPGTRNRRVGGWSSQARQPATMGGPDGPEKPATPERMLFVIVSALPVMDIAATAGSGDATTLNGACGPDAGIACRLAWDL